MYLIINCEKCCDAEEEGEKRAGNRVNWSSVRARESFLYIGDLLWVSWSDLKTKPEDEFGHRWLISELIPGSCVNSREVRWKGKKTINKQVTTVVSGAPSCWGLSERLCRTTLECLTKGYLYTNSHPSFGQGHSSGVKVSVLATSPSARGT